MSQGYTDIVMRGDRLIANVDGEIKTFTVVNMDYALLNGKHYRINHRGNNARVFVGNYKVIARI